jgi:threonine synthase
MTEFSVDYESLIRKTRGSASGGEKLIRYLCLLCGQEAADLRANRCASCGGAIDAIYDLDQAAVPQRRETPNTIKHFFSLLPLRDPSALGWLGEGNTPCFEVPELAGQLGIGRLFFKDESVNPTRSTKDRIASVGFSRFSEIGVSDLVMASTGNSSTAYARGAQLLPGFRLHVFIGRDFLDRLNYPDNPAVTTHVVDGGFVAAGQMGQRFAKQEGYYWEGGFFNLARREGLKTAYLEAFDEMPAQPDYVFQAVSSGMGLLGGFKGAIEYREIGRLSRLPAFVGVQQASCAPMAHAFAEGAESISDRHIVHEPAGIAHAILRGDPSGSYPYIRELCLRSGGRIVAAGEPAIRRARALLARIAGLNVCLASATAFAGVVKAAREGVLSPDSVVLVNLTGADRPAIQRPRDVTVWRAA